MEDSVEKFYEEWHESARSNRSEELRDRDLMALNYVKDCNSVLELGCGCGYVLNKTTSSVKAGIDISKTAIEFAKVEVNSSVATDLRVVNIDKESLPWENGVYDGCMAIEVLEHLFDPVKALAELNRVLKDDGKLVVTIPNIGYFIFRYYHMVTGEVSDFHGNGMIVNEHIRFYSVKSMVSLLKLTGFGDIKVRGALKLVVPDGQKTNVSAPSTPKKKRSIGSILYALRPTPINIISKLNRILGLWKIMPSLFAVGLVIEARKVCESQYKYNEAIDHQHTSSQRERINVHNI